MENHTTDEHVLNCLQCTDKSCAAMVLNPGELSLLNSNCGESRFQDQEIILNEGTFTSHIIYLKSGLVKEFQKRNNKQEHIIQILKSHTYLGLQSIFGDKTNQYSYAALTDVTVCYINDQLFKSLLSQNSKFSYQILEIVCRDTLNNYHRFINLQQKNISGKLADTLLYFANQVFQNNEFKLPLNRSEIGFLIGTSRESVTKQLNLFQADGLIEIKDNWVKLIGLEKIKAISKFG